MTDRVLSAFELNQLMLQRSRDWDTALAQYAEASELWGQAHNLARKRQAQAFAFCKGKTVNETRALVDIECDEELSAEVRLEILRNSASKALEAAKGQMSALQSMSSALREEIRMARSGPMEQFG